MIGAELMHRPSKLALTYTLLQVPRFFIAVALITLACSCGSGSSGTVAGPQTAKLNWRENCGTRADPIPIATRRLVVREGVWRVALSFRNRTRVTLWVMRPHVPRGTYFGLEPFRTSSRQEVVERAESAGAKPRTIAEHFSPPLPRLLPPGRGWSGEFSGRAALPAGVPIRVVLGRFVVDGRAPSEFFSGFLCISERVIRLS
jgi:hypothetical protein